jgi:hypothetical protein
LVCSAIELIALMTCPISLDEAPSLATVSLVVVAICAAWAATLAASVEFWAISRMEALICSAPAATVCTLRETCSAADATTPACADVSSDPAATWLDDADSSSAAAATVCADSTTSDITARRLAWAADSEDAIWPTSSRLSTPASAVRSPSARRSTACCTRRRLPTIVRVMSTLRPAAASSPRASATRTIRVESEVTCLDACDTASASPRWASDSAFMTSRTAVVWLIRSDVASSLYSAMSPLSAAGSTCSWAVV